MKCTRYDRWIWDDLKGRLGVAQAQELQAHLQSCPRCQRQRDAALATHRALQTLPRRRAPQNLAQQVLTRLQGQSTPKPVSAWWKRAALAPALGLVVAAAWWGWLTFNPNGANPEVATTSSQSEESWVEIHEQLEVADWSPTASYFIKTGYTR